MLRIYTMLLFLFAGMAHTIGQEHSNFHFKKFQVGDGLSENAVYAILQDSEGFMWFGTKDGLNRFDGSGFRHYRYDADKDKSLGNNFIRSMVQINKESLVIGTDAGLYLMNLADESFTRLDTRASDQSQITSAVNSLLIDQKGTLWIGTMSQGIYTYDIQKKAFDKAGLNNISMGGNATWSIIEDKSGTIWAGTRLGLLRYDTVTKSFEAVDPLFGKSENYDHEILSILEDSSGNLWLGTWSQGLRYYNKQTNRFTSYLNSHSKPPYITHIRTIYQFNSNTLMIGSDDGLYLFNTDTRSSKRMDVPQFEYSLSDQNIYSLCRDKEGGLWIGTYFGGVNYLNTALSSIETYYPHSSRGLSGKAVSQFCEDESGNLWIATEDGGLNYFDVSTKTISQPVKTSYHNTHALLLDGDELWIGTFSRGIDRYNTKTKKLVNFRYSAQNAESINDDCIFSLYKTRAGEIYAGTPVGLNKFDRGKKTFIRVPEVSGFIYDMKEDDSGNLWLASYGSGAIRRDAKSGKWVHYDQLKGKNNPIAESKLTSIYIDSQRRIIFTSEGRGIFIYDESADDFRNISETEGLPNNVIYGVLDDPSGNLWLSSNKGLICLDIDRVEDFKLYTIEEGLQSNQFNYKSSYKTGDGKFYFGGINGFNSFYPQELSRLKNPILPSVVITGLSLLGHADPSARKEIQARLNQKQHIELENDKSSFTISFVSLSYLSQSKNQYAYKLEGVDADWNMAGNNKNVTYVNLPPGKYLFKVKASNNDGLWNEAGSEIEIEILPPVWLSMPAKILYVILLTALAFLIANFYVQNNRRKQSQQLKAFKTEQETIAFKSKIDFFTTVAHEIKTPLSLISAPLEEIVAGGEGSDETKQNLSIIEKNCDRLTDLINQLLDFRKMDAAKYVVNPEKIDLNEYIAEMYEKVKKTAQKKNLVFELQLPSSPGLQVISDADALTKIVGNLLTNALKFARHKITLKLVRNADRSFTISVEDDGAGIADDLKNLIFDPFYQVPSAEENIGTGIGLSLVKHLAGVLNAQIEVKDGSKSGTVFLFTFSDLEIPEETPAVNARLSVVKNESAALLSESAGANVLVVDDNPDMTLFIENCLAKDYIIEKAGNAREALRSLKKKHYHLIISDVMMPDIDGISLVRKLKTDLNHSHIPVILLSARTENATKIDGLRSGAEVFIEKPFSPLYLKAQISTLLKNRKAILEVFNSSPLAPYSSIVTNKSDEHFLNRLNEGIEKRIADENFTVESLTDIFHFSRSSLQRKLKSISGQTPGDYLRTYRLKKACALLLESDSRINEVAFRVGFNSASYFTKAFYKQYHMSPKEFINRHLTNVKKSS